MRFQDYLKHCRIKAELTQEQLVQALYIHDTEIFNALETSTISKWERGVVMPQITKQVSIIRYFQERTHHALPCFEKESPQNIEEHLCKNGIQNLIGKSKQLILNFPSSVIGINDLMVYPLRHSPNMEKYLAINLDLDKDFNHDLSGLELSHFQAWALNPANQFYLCEYKDQFFGLLFTLRLKPETFGQLMKFERTEVELTEKDFASPEERCCNYILSFFALNEKAANLLFIRYYAHLIANQDTIEKVGVMTMMDDGKRLISNMNLTAVEKTRVDEDHILESYQSELSDFLAHERVMRMLFQRESVHPDNC